MRLLPRLLPRLPLVFALAGLLAGAGCASRFVERPDPPPAADLAGRFEQIAFFNEFDDLERPLARFETWNAPILITPMLDNPGDLERYDDHIAATVAELGRLTGRRFEFGPDGSMILVMGPRRRLGQMAHEVFAEAPDHRLRSDAVWLARRATCSVLMFQAARDGSLAGGVVFIDTDLPLVEIRQCVVQELTQSLGLPNDIDDPNGTVFSSRSRLDHLSAVDRKIVRILYDSRLYSGMTRAEAMPIVRQIIAENGW
ncbi:MAG: DUF2927 domain-containing protein [Inquilinaceae bacterium]